MLRACGAVTVADNRVAPLADHLWPPAHAPGLSLVGLPFKTVPFPLCEAQACRVARALSGAAPLQGAAELAARAEAQVAACVAEGRPVRHSHLLGDAQWDYMAALTVEAWPGEAAQAAKRTPPPWRPALYAAASAARRADVDGYRDAGAALVCEAALQAEAEAEAWLAARGVGGAGGGGGGGAATAEATVPG